MIGIAAEPRRVARKTSVDEDEGFCDSDSTDKAPILPPRQDDIQREERKKKNPLRKRVSFRNDVDEIPSMEIKINQSIVSMEMKQIQNDSPSKSPRGSDMIDEKQGYEYKTKNKSRGEKSKRSEKHSENNDNRSRHKRKQKR